MKGKSESKVREALNQVELSGLVVYKPPDDARNWKPCDYIVWWQAGEGSGEHPSDMLHPHSAWLEVKECKAVGTFNAGREIRPSQRKAIAEAAAIGLPYLLIIWWPKRGAWTITPLRAVPHSVSIPFKALASEGVDALPGHLAGTLRAALAGEIW